MVDITHKSDSLRQAIAKAIVRTSSQETIDAVVQRKVPKGDVFEFARAAGLLAVKKTSDVIPDCHPLPVEYAAISYQVIGLEVIITVEVRTIYKTGVEVEAMHGAAITALTMYDMLKPIDKHIEIRSIALESKKGGKSEKALDGTGLRAVVIVCSDTISAGKGEDRAGEEIRGRLEEKGIAVVEKLVIPDDVEGIREKGLEFSRTCDLVVFVGGTGVSPRDNTPEAIRPILTREIPGIMETARQYGQQRMPFAMLSRGVAGMIGDALVITLPGSTKGAMETLDAIFPQVLHVFNVNKGQRHD
ncbi:MAG: bifunctional molybdenum cofactor biosynthesis protein MoaC/MoaB [Chitinophagaceae bacterium]